ncbi:MAG: ATP-binding cassette domain-containing protein [Polyangiaceae bacterium]
MGKARPSLISYYVYALRRELHEPRKLIGFLVASAAHAVGHALMALVAAAIALCLAEHLGDRTLSHASSSVRIVAGHSLFNLRLFRSGSVGDEALVLSLVGLLVVFVKGSAGAYATFVQARVAGEVGGALRLKLLDAMLAVHRLRRPRHSDHGSTALAHPPTPALGEMRGIRAVASLTERVRDVETGLEPGLLGRVRAIALIVPILLLLVALSVHMAVAAALILVGFGWALGRVRSGYLAATRRAAREREHLLEAADEAVRHADLWVSYGAEAKARESTRAMGHAIAEGSARLQTRGAILSSANEVLGAAALVGGIASARAGWAGSGTDGTTLLAFAVSFFLAYRPLRELADSRLALMRAKGAYDEIGGVIAEAADRKDDHAGDDDPAEDPRLETPSRTWPLATIELRALRLARGTCAPLSLRIEAGAIAVIVGPTGAGKTTLLRTLLGLEDALGGDILFGADSIAVAPAGPRTRPFAWVPQDAPLLADTLTANVTLAAPEADAHRVLEFLGAGHLVSSVEDARLGVGGRAVSGGERQWIALARAIATQQPVLLLDEPTSGLDAKAQERVLAAIARLRGSRTVLIVTHRPEPIGIADVVVRLDA